MGWVVGCFRDVGLQMKAKTSEDVTWDFGSLSESGGSCSTSSACFTTSTRLRDSEFVFFAEQMSLEAPRYSRGGQCRLLRRLLAILGLRTGAAAMKVYLRCHSICILQAALFVLLCLYVCTGAHSDMIAL